MIPRWIETVRSGKTPVIYGDGTQSRDFCSVQNVVKANILAALNSDSRGKIFNIGCGVNTTLNELLGKIYAVFAPDAEAMCIYEPVREGDIKYSCASIDFAREVLKFSPSVYLEEGLKIIHDYQA